MAPSSSSSPAAGGGGTFEKSPLLLALMEHRVAASVKDLDHYRIRGGMAVETDYIIKVTPKGQPKGKDPEFEPFILSKTYSAFRTLGHQLKKAADAATSRHEILPKSVEKLAKYAETIVLLVEAQRTQYLGKVNYSYVKALAKKRSQIINEILETTLSYFPEEVTSHPFLLQVAQTIETFFLLDHCEISPDDDSISVSSRGKHKTPKKYEKRKAAKSPSRVNRDISPTPATRSEAAYNNNNNNNNASSSSISSSEDNDFLKQSTSKQKETIHEDNPLEFVGNFIKQTFSNDENDDKKNGSNKSSHKLSVNTRPSLGTQRHLRSPVVPYTRKSRRPRSTRVLDDDDLKEVGSEPNLLLDDDRPQTMMVPSYTRPMSSFQSPGSKLGDILETNPIVFALIAAASVYFLKQAARMTITMDVDIQLLLIFSSFCIGLHTPRPMVGGIDTSMGPPPPPETPPPPPTPTLSTIDESERSHHSQSHDTSGRMLLRKCLVASPDASSNNNDRTMSFRDIMVEENIHNEIENQGPLPRYPPNAELGTHFNCWSEPAPGDFKIRGAKYLTDGKKIPSGPFIFPVRGIDLFLTDTCPENAGSNSGVFGGNLRNKPTFIINFRLPWGILLCYFEIPERFLPFLKSRYEHDFDKSKIPSMDGMTPSDRCVARFLSGTDEHKSANLKIVPVVAQGPWVVKSVVGGKPALIGTKLPVHYFYQREEKGKACYLEADLDVVASSAARGILSVARTYTQVLTLDLGFVVQGNSNDELPEQMLVGARLHGLDPMSAPPLPLMGSMLMQDNDDDDSSKG